MSHRGLNFDEATRQVANLMAATGQSVSAYEDEHLSRESGSFEAASARVEEHEQHTDHTPRSSLPRRLIREMGQITEDGHYEPSAEEERLLFSSEESSPIAPEARELQEDDAYFCVTDLNLIPPPLEAGLYEFHQIVEFSGSLEPFWLAFEAARRTGEAQTVNLPDRTLTMSQERGLWNILDEFQNLQYCEGRFENHEIVDPTDLFIWVKPLDRNANLGYIHNGCVFLRK